MVTQRFQGRCWAVCRHSSFALPAVFKVKVVLPLKTTYFKRHNFYFEGEQTLFLVWWVSADKSASSMLVTLVTKATTCCNHPPTGSQQEVTDWFLGLCGCGFSNYSHSGNTHLLLGNSGSPTALHGWTLSRCWLWPQREKIRKVKRNQEILFCPLTEWMPMTTWHYQTPPPPLALSPSPWWAVWCLLSLLTCLFVHSFSGCRPTRWIFSFNWIMHILWKTRHFYPPAICLPGLPLTTRYETGIHLVLYLNERRSQPLVAI